MRNQLMKKISIIILAACLSIPIAVLMSVTLKAAEPVLEEEVYQTGYAGSILDLIEVKQAGEGTDIDGDGTLGGLTDLAQMRNFLVDKTRAFYRTQGVKYEYDATASNYYVSANQSCDSGIAKAGGTLTVLAQYDDGVNGQKIVKHVAENAFVQCTAVNTVVLPTDSEFKLLGNNFTTANQNVDICAAGQYEPVVDISTNIGLSGKIYHKEGTNGTDSGDCATWKYDEEGNIEKAQFSHTFGDDDVCTNVNCKKQSVDGLTVERNYFAPRIAKTMQVETVPSYSGKDQQSGETITEKNVVKITTTGSIADFVMVLPEKVQNTLSIRVLVESSTATHIRMRTVKTNGGEGNAKGQTDIAAGTALTEDALGVWLEYQLDYSDVSGAYKDRLAMMIAVANGSGSEEHVFYVAYAIDTDKIPDKLASDLPEGYVADFSSSLYRLLVEDGGTSNTVKTTWLESYKGEEGVLKVEVTGTSPQKDFVLTLPKSHSGKYTLRMYISSSTNVGQMGTCKSNSGWANAFFSDYYSYETEKWLSIPIDDSNADFNNAKIGLMGYDGSNHTFEVYLAWVIDGSDNTYVTEAEETWYTNIKNELAVPLTGDALADFSSSAYEHIILDDPTTNELKTEWLSEYEGAEGVMKVEVTKKSSNKLDFTIDLPKEHTGTYTMRIYVGSTTKVYQLGIATAGGAWNTDNGISKIATANGAWQEVTIDASNDGYEGKKIRIQGFDGDSDTDDKVEIYFDWIKNVPVAE